MRNTEFYGILAILILGSALILTPIALSYLTANITIQNSGKIITEKALITQKSEIRGVLVDEDVFVYTHNWTLIAETLANYSINAVFVNDFSTFGRRPDNEIRAAIDAFHAKGIEYHSLMNVLQDTRPSTSLGTEEIDPDGNIYSVYSHCPIKAHDYVVSAIQNYLGNFSDVDGIMLDFIRYSDEAVTCYCPHCRDAFEEWLGEEITNWTQFYPNQPRWGEFLEWRTVPLTALVKDIHDTIKAINPNIIISEAAWTVSRNNPVLFRKYLGQDTAAWIKEGYIDLVAPMVYTQDLNELESFLDGHIKYWMGGQPEGPIPVTPFLDCARGINATQLKAEIDLVREKGLDGWILWHYGGPGDGETSPDIRDFLSIIDMPETFTITNVHAETSTNATTITWLTTMPATSKVEYNTSPIFGASWEYWYFHYWNITYTPGIIIEDSINVTSHSITLTDLTPGVRYYFRVQSMGLSGTATSKVLTFTTKT